MTDLVQDRAGYREAAVSEITEHWGPVQELTGPLLAIPYEWKSGVDEKGKTLVVRRVAYFLPEELSLENQMGTEIRHRGIFKTVLYNLKTDFTGEFRMPGIERFPSGTIRMDRSRTRVILGATDTRGIKESVTLQFSGHRYEFLPGTRDAGFSSGMYVPVNLSGVHSSGKLPFSFSLHLRGSGGLYFAPAGKRTRVSLSSDWPTPAFRGSFLPEKREITPGGFRSFWQIAYYGRDYAQDLFPEDTSVASLLQSHSTFGVELLVPVDTYRSVLRSLKYATLFLFVTFTAFFLFEVFHNFPLHPVQYALVGGALIVFYLLFVALAEHIPFPAAYLVATASTILLITLYSASILGRGLLALIPGGILTALYGYLYVVLKSEDFALLLGSLILFVLLSTVMYLTRKIDWSDIRKD